MNDDYNLHTYISYNLGTTEN